MYIECHWALFCTYANNMAQESRRVDGLTVSVSGSVMVNACPDSFHSDLSIMFGTWTRKVTGPPYRTETCRNLTPTSTTSENRFQKMHWLSHSMHTIKTINYPLCIPLISKRVINPHTWLIKKFPNRKTVICDTRAKNPSLVVFGIFYWILFCTASA